MSSEQSTAAHRALPGHGVATLNAVSRLLPDAVALLSAGHEVIQVNSAFCRLFSCQEADIVGRTAADLFVDVSPSAFDVLDRCVRNEGARELVCSRFDCSTFQGEIRCAAVDDADGESATYLLLIKDVSLHFEDDQSLQPLLESAPIGILLTQRDGRIRMANKDIERLFGYRREELIDQSIEILLPDRFREVHTRHRAGYVTKPYLRPMGTGLNLVGRRKSGFEFPVEVSLNIVDVRNESLVMGFVVDVTRKQQLEDALRESEQLLQSTIASMKEQVLILDRNGVILNFAKSTQVGHPFSTQWQSNKHYQEALPAALSQKLDAAIEDVRVTGDVSQMEFILESDGRVNWFEANVSARWDKDEKFDGVTIVVRDVTARRAAEQQVMDNAEQLKTQNAELDAFAHTVAHDLINPVALVLGYIEELQIALQEGESTRAEESLEQVEISARRINRIINELLLLASIRKSDVAMTPINMMAVIEEAQSRHSYLYKKHQVKVEMDYSWPAVLGYAPWVEEVWSNYLSNAIKYGGPTPSIRLGAEESPDGMVRFWVQDQGPGISTEDQTKLFTPFTQVSQAQTKGHGLGLSIVRRIVEKCGGQVGVDSAPGAGSTFWFTLPAAGTKA